MKFRLEYLSVLGGIVAVAVVAFSLITTVDAQAVGPVMRSEEYANGGLVRVLELQDVAGVVEFRRLNSSRQVVEQRPATAEEQAVYARYVAGVARETDQEAVRDFEGRIATIAATLDACAANWNSLTAGQKDGCMRQTVNALGEFLQRWKATR